MTRQEMIDALIENNYDSMDYKDLYRFFEYYMQREYADWTTEQIETDYKERLGAEDDT